jgi:VCBS repeat protein
MEGINTTLATILGPSYAANVPDLKWEIRAIADVNNDGSADLIWQHGITGRLAVWFLSGGTCIGTNYVYAVDRSSSEVDLGWKIVAAGDMDRDGRADLLWRHMASGEIRLWHMTGNVQWDSVTVATVTDLEWKIVGLADMNADGMLDFVWRHSSTGKIAAWFMHDAVFQQATRLSPAELTDTNWRIVGVADMNMDQRPDLVWQNVATGGLGAWFMDGVTMTHGSRLNLPSVSDLNWRIVGVK